MERIRGGWYHEQLSQKSPWFQIFHALDMKEKQKKSIIAILELMALRGQEHSSHQLASHGSSKKSWSSTFVSRREMRELAAELDEKGTCSYRYCWYLIQWLIRNGWIEEDTAIRRGCRLRGYSFSDRAFQFAAHLYSCIPKIWVNARWTPKRDLKKR